MVALISDNPKKSIDFTEMHLMQSNGKVVMAYRSNQAYDPATTPTIYW
jgi:hypothetical protein